EEGIRYYQIYRAALQRAINENPRNPEVNERAIEEQYRAAQWERAESQWTHLEELVTKLLTNQGKPSVKMYDYRAEAVLQWAKLLKTEVPESRLAAVEEDL